MRPLIFVKENKSYLRRENTRINDHILLNRHLRIHVLIVV